MYDIEKSKYAQKAMELFREGYNCSQSVFLAFEDKLNMDRSVVLKLSSSLGGGMGRLREVCGAVSGMFLVAGVLYGYDDPKDYEHKKNTMQESSTLQKNLKQKTIPSFAGNFWDLVRARMHRHRNIEPKNIIRKDHVQNL